jgi:excisionase family DNA binding protein
MQPITKLRNQEQISDMKNQLIEEPKIKENLFIRSNPPHNMNARELSIYLGISERKIRTDAANGTIPSVKIGGRVLFRLKDIETCLEKLQRGNRN